MVAVFVAAAKLSAEPALDLRLVDAPAPDPVALAGRRMMKRHFV
jgi:hypothetical protein